MSGDASVLESLHSVDGEGVVRMEHRIDTGDRRPLGSTHRSSAALKRLCSSMTLNNCVFV